MASSTNKREHLLLFAFAHFLPRFRFFCLVSFINFCAQQDQYRVQCKQRHKSNHSMLKLHLFRSKISIIWSTEQNSIRSLVHTGTDDYTNPACLNELLLLLWIAMIEISLQLKIARWCILSVISVHHYFVLIQSAIKSSNLGLSGTDAAHHGNQS